MTYQPYTLLIVGVAASGASWHIGLHNITVVSGKGTLSHYQAAGACMYAVFYKSDESISL